MEMIRRLLSLKKACKTESPIEVDICSTSNWIVLLTTLSMAGLIVFMAVNEWSEIVIGGLLVEVVLIVWINYGCIIYKLYKRLLRGDFSDIRIMCGKRCKWKNKTMRSDAENGL